MLLLMGHDAALSGTFADQDLMLTDAMHGVAYACFTLQTLHKLPKSLLSIPAGRGWVMQVCDRD